MRVFAFEYDVRCLIMKILFLISIHVLYLEATFTRNNLKKNYVNKSNIEIENTKHNENKVIFPFFIS